MSQRNIDRTNWLGVCLLVIGIVYLNKNFYWDFFQIQRLLTSLFVFLAGNFDNRRVPFIAVW